MQQSIESNGFFKGKNSGNGIAMAMGMEDLPHAKYLLATITLPRNNSAREIFSPEVVQASIDYIIDIFGGGTEYAPGIGYWRNERRGLDIDRISVIQVVIPYTTQFLIQLSVIAQKLGTELDQDEIFIICTPAYFVTDLILADDGILW